jgi:hypothetical protein
MGVNYKLFPLVLINELSIPFHFKNLLFTHFQLFYFFKKIDIIKQYFMTVCLYIITCFLKCFFKLIFTLKNIKLMVFYIFFDDFNVMIL